MPKTLVVYRCPSGTIEWLSGLDRLDDGDELEDRAIHGEHFGFPWAERLHDAFVESRGGHVSDDPNRYVWYEDEPGPYHFAFFGRTAVTRNIDNHTIRASPAEDAASALVVMEDVAALVAARPVLAERPDLRRPLDLYLAVYRGVQDGDELVYGLLL